MAVEASGFGFAGDFGAAFALTSVVAFVFRARAGLGFGSPVAFAFAARRGLAGASGVATASGWDVPSGFPAEASGFGVFATKRVLRPVGAVSSAAACVAGDAPSTSARLRRCGAAGFSRMAAFSGAT